MPRKIKIDDEPEKKKKPDVKKRNWAFVLYPDSAPEDWKDRLIKTGLPCVISPLHDKDLNPTGEVKKAHYHVVLMFPGPTTYNSVKKITDSLNQPIPQPCENVRGYYRYLTHKDNPEKAQYSEKDIIPLNGFNILDFVELSKSEVNAIKRKLQNFIRDADILEYCDLMDMLLDSDAFTAYDVASSHTFFFEKYLASRRNSKFRAKNQNVEGVNNDDFF